MFLAIIPEIRCKKLHLFILFQSVFASINALSGVIWSNRRNMFVPIHSIPEFAALQQKIFIQSREKETHDFKGQMLKFTSSRFKNLLIFREDGATITGIYGDIWTILSEFSNFTLVPVELSGLEVGIRHKDGNWDGLLGILQRNETDVIPRSLSLPSRSEIMQFTTPLWKTRFRLYIQEEWKYDPAWMVNLFTPKVWIVCIATLIILCIISFILRYVTVDEIAREDSPSGGEYVISTISLFCVQGCMPQILERRSKVFLFSVSLFSWVMWLAFNAKLISHMARRDSNPPFNDLLSLYKETDYTVLGMNGSVIHSAFLKSIKPAYRLIYDNHRVLFMSSFEEADKRLCSKNGKYAFYEADEVVQSKIMNRCEIAPVSKGGFSNWIASGLVKGFKYKKTIDIGIMKLHEFGLMSVLKTRWLPGMNEKKAGNAPEPIRMQQVARIFSLLFLGILVSFIICLMENIIYVASYYKAKRPRLTRTKKKSLRRKRFKSQIANVL